MKDYKVYVCEKCGLEFPNDYQRCEEHESNHVNPESFGIMNNGNYQPKDKYPTLIRIPMADGAEVMYVFDGVVREAEQTESPLLPAEDLLEEK